MFSFFFGNPKIPAEPHLGLSWKCTTQWYGMFKPKTNTPFTLTIIELSDGGKKVKVARNGCFLIETKWYDWGAFKKEVLFTDKREEQWAKLVSPVDGKLAELRLAQTIERLPDVDPSTFPATYWECRCDSCQQRHRCCHRHW